MPSTAGSVWHPRSAEQTARLLLSNAFRHDTWECAAARRQAQFYGGAVQTLRLRFRELSKQFVVASDVEAVNLALFDLARKMFVGATYQLEARDITRPLVVRVSPTQLLVVETVVQDIRPSAPLEEYRVTSWGYCPVEEMKGGAISIKLLPGSAHLLLVEKSLWPAVSLPTAPSDVALICDVGVDQDPALTQVMEELVPPGIFVAEDFTRATPKPGASLFRLRITNMELSGSTKESALNLADPDADWSVAAVAHNGFQQLGKGSEVPLILETSSDGDRRGSSPNTSTTSTRPPPVVPTVNTVVLRSDMPLDIDRLPVHSTTSLVLAIRRRAPGSRAFAVLGFCVLPLCMMPMRDRDIQVENLPALRGPFSCEDARLLMVDSTSPYGRVPIALTLTVEYHDTGISGGAASEEAAAATSPTAPQPKPKPEEITKDEASSYSLTSSASSVVSGSRPTQVLSTADVPDRGPVSGSLSYTSSQTPTVSATAADGGDSAGIFKLLCTIMEELRKVRESQDMFLRQRDRSDLSAISPALQERLNKGLADGGVDVVDLAPRPIAVSWRARKLMQEGAQPLLHPLHGTLLDDAAPAVGQLALSLYGFRVEGITVDSALYIPADMCLLFSFGPLPYQRAGPLHLTSVEKTPTNESFKVYDDRRLAGFVWCEPTEALQSVTMRKYKSASNAIIYIHLYDALTMFYVATASLPLATFRRPISAMCAMTPMDVVLQRDLSMTEQVVPPKVFPVMQYAGQLHLTVFCVGIPAAAGEKSLTAALATVRMPELAQSRVITAKKLQHADRLGPTATTAPSSAITGATLVNGGTSASPGTADPPGRDANGGSGADKAAALHWKRAQHFKAQLREHQQCVGAVPQLPGVPDAHVQAAQEAAELEFRLRQLEYERAAIKSRRIAEALLSRLTVEHDVLVISWRPEVVRTTFANPFSCAMEFFLEVDSRDTDVCTVMGAPNFVLGPREKTELSLVIRLSIAGAAGGSVASRPQQEQQNITARVYSEKRELASCIRVRATVHPPLVDRRYEIFGAPGTEVVKRILSRAFSPANFPITSDSAALLKRMRELCAFVATSSEKTSVSTNAVLDPITQTYITAWEEATVTTEIPRDADRQRIEYVTLFYDAAMSRVYETWEICVFACDSFLTRDIFWGQTTALGLPAEGTSNLYCSDTTVLVERRGASYVLRLHPRDVGTQRLLLHTLQNDALKKTLLSVQTVHPTPTYSQVIELSLADVQAPVLRRLTFVHRGDHEESFQVNHNYKFNLRVSPSKFTLAPSDTQFISLQFDLLTLPPGQLEGRWPMWIFINNAEDKTVESYHLQVVLRAHPIVRVEA
ncbi:hypothetical protein LSCM1_05416 [Leishmania martiniquensis]|uniref:NPHP4 Ig-like domain-containing protein n=1 Tax=Leishmania martiniquensis TaxID=1580590 RepID=A0A836H3T0_9TRYP|nr:hypothetical protein LSCM1_05416 [Leishmania martiniquensis]